MDTDEGYRLFEESTPGLASSLKLARAFEGTVRYEAADAAFVIWLVDNAETLIAAQVVCENLQAVLDGGVAPADLLAGWPRPSK